MQIKNQIGLFESTRHSKDRRKNKKKNSIGYDQWRIVKSIGFILTTYTSVFSSFYGNTIKYLINGFKRLIFMS